MARTDRNNFKENEKRRTGGGGDETKNKSLYKEKVSFSIKMNKIKKKDKGEIYKKTKGKKREFWTTKQF